MADENVVNYEGNKISLYTPKEGGQRDIAYVRPGDEINLNFDIRDTSALKVEVTKGDLHIVFANGSTLTLASMAAIGFSNGAPKIITLDGRTLSLEEFLSVTEVLNYNEALLILANENHVEHSNEEPKLIQVSSDQDADNEAGTPITGQGTSDVLSKGVPADIIDTTGLVETQGTSVSTGSFVSTIWTTNYPYTLDKTNYLPGDTTEKNQPSLDVTVYYGSQLSKIGNTNIGNKNYSTYNYENGFGYTDDAFSQLYANQIREGGSSENIFVNNSSEDMKYVFNMNYAKGIFPSYIEIVVPKSVEHLVKLAEFAGMTFSNVSSTEDGTVYAISEINPVGIMQFLMSFPTNTQITNFDLSYNIKYLDPSSGEFLTATSTTSLSLYPVSEESQLDKSNGFVLSTVPNPVDVVTGSGDDLIVGGGGDNTINSGAGNDQIFTYGGNDIVDVGSGDNQVWGSQGNDILNGGSGNNKLYYDNRNTNIDPTGVSFKEYYYNTNTASAGISIYYGFDVDSLKSFAGDDFINLLKIQDNDIIIKKSQGSDIVRGFQDIYLSQYNDNLIVSDTINLGNIRIHGGDLTNSRTDIDIVTIDDNFVDAIIRVATDSTVEKSDGTVLVTFTDFETVKGSKNNDIFYSDIIAGFSGTTTAITLDGMGGYDILSYENLTSGSSIEFTANTGLVQKKDNTGSGVGADSIKNFEEIKASSGDDIFYGSFSNNYVYSSLGSGDLVSYEKSNAAVTMVLDGNSSGDFNIYKTTAYMSNADLSSHSDIYKDTLQGALDINNNLKLSNKNDIIIVTDEAGSYQLNAGVGKDILSYMDLTNGINVVFDNSGIGTVTKTGGGVDTFNVMISNGSDTTVNIYNIIGTAGDDTFVMGDGDGNRSGFSLDGKAGTNTLSYDNVSKDSVGDGTGFGVTFVFSGGGNSTVTRSASSITDYFANFQVFIGSDFKDNVVFSSNTTLAEIQGLSFDLGAGEDTVSFISLSNNEVDYIDVSFNSGNMEVSYYKGGNAVGSSEFVNTEGIYGTAGDDIFRAISGVNLFFDGSAGTDTADYSNVNDDVTFNLFQKVRGNVIKGSNTDTLLNVEHIIGGTGVNTYYLDSSISYTIDGNGTSNIVSYHNATSPITYNVASNIVTKGSGASQQTDTLNNVDTVKGSTWNDTFVIDFNMTNPLPTYRLYGNDIYGDGSGNMINPTSDTDLVNLTSFTVPVSLTLDSSQAGSYNVYDSSGKITAEGFVSINVPINSGNITLELYHVEGFLAGSADDSFDLISSYEAAFGKTRWYIDGGAGTNTVSYENDTNLSNLQPNGSNGNVLQVNLSNAGATVARFYNNSGGQTSRVEDTLINIQKLVLSTFDDVVNINTGWENSKISEIDGGAGNDTLSFLGITDEIRVDFDTAGAFSAQILNATGVLPTFSNFENIRLSSGKSTVHFQDGSNFANPVTITGSSNSNSEAILDFSSMSSSITITLSQDRDGVDTIAGSMTANLVFISSFSHGGYTVSLADNNNVIYGSSQKHMDFESASGSGTGNTLDYSNVTTLGIKINLTQDGGKVIKNNNDIIYDTFDNSFSTINGTSKVDTVWITDLNVSFSSKNINLGGQQGDNVLIDITGGAIYDINSSMISDSTGGGNLNISGINGVDSINFADNDDTIVFSTAFESNNNPMAYANYNGGGGNNKLDFSALQNIIFDANTQKISKDSVGTDYNNINWVKGRDYTGSNVDLVFQRFYTITAAATDTIFYGQARNNYTFVGGAGNDTINYSQSASNVFIYLLDYKIQKNDNTSTVDTFDAQIDEIVGSNSNDTLIIDKITSPTTGMNLEIDGGGGNNTVDFKFDQASGTHVNVVFNSTGDATFDLINGGTTTTVTVGLQNFQSYIFTENDDIISVDASLGQDTRFNGDTGTDTIKYTGTESIIYDSTRGQVKRGPTGNITDTINYIEIISYEGGKGTATFLGSETANRTYIGDSTRNVFDTTNYSDAVIDYSNQSPGSAIRVDFALNNNLMSITKGSSAGVDYFNSYITKIIGTKGNDVFVLADRDGNLPKIRLEGGGGNDKVSFANYSGSGAEFEVDANGQVSIIGGSNNFSGYVVDSNSIKGFELTGGDDIFHGSLTSELDIDGGNGIDTLDYSTVNANITIDFSGTQGTVQKNDVANNRYYTDKFSNFEGVKTGSGDDTIIIADNIISGGSTGNFDVGSGNNTLDATRITYNMDVIYGGITAADQFKSNITYSGTGNPVSGVYNGFQQISLGSGSNSVTYYHDAAYESLSLRFSTNTGSSDTFTLAGSANKTFFVDAVSDFNSFLFSTTSAGSTFMEAYGFANIMAKDTTYALSITASGLTNNHTFWGGTTAGDEISYSNAISGLVAGVKTDSSNNKYIEIKGTGTNNFIDNLYNIENITLSDEDDTFEIDDITGYGNGTITVDAGGGTNNTLSLANLATGINATINASGGLELGGAGPSANLSVANFQNTSLTNQNDTVVFREDTSTIVNGNGGTDTADYTTNSFTDGVILTVVQNITGNTVMNVNKKASSKDDQLENFEVFNLTNNDDEFVYIGNLSLGTATIVIDMLQGNDTVDFSGMDTNISGTQFLYDTNGVLNITNSSAGLNYKISNMNTIILGGTNSALTIQNMPSGGSPVTFDGGSATNISILDLSQLNNGAGLIADLFNETVSDINNTLGLNYVNFRGITGSTKITTYKMAEVNKNNEGISYQIDTQNADAIISYDNSGILDSITVEIDGDEATVTKSNNETDSIKGGFSEFQGSENDDTFIFTSNWKDGLVIDGGAGSIGESDTLDLSQLSDDLNYEIDLSVSTGDVATIDNKKATFKNFNNITGAQARNEFILALAGIARDYTGVTLTGGSATNVFTTSGSNLGGGSAIGNVSIISNISSFTSFIDNFSVSVSLIDFSTLQFNAEMDINLDFEDYTTSTVTKVTANSSRNNSANISRNSSNVTVNENNGAIEFVLGDGTNSIVTLDGFKELVLGSQQDILTFASFVSGIDINSGGSGVATPDTLNVSISDFTMYLSNDVIQVYNSTSPNYGSDPYAQFVNFPIISSTSSNAKVYILDNARISYLQKLELGGNGSLYLVANDGSSPSISEARLSITAGTTYSIQINSANFDVTGITQFYFGDGNDTVNYDSGNSADLHIYGNGGNNTFNISNASSTAPTYVQLIVNGDTIERAQGNLEVKDFYNINMSGLPSATDKRINIEKISESKPYNFINVDSIIFNSSDFQTNHVNSAYIDGSNIQFVSSTKDISVFATFADSSAPSFSFSGSTSLDYDFRVKLTNLSNSNANSISKGINAPTMQSGFHAILDLTDLMESSSPGTSYIIDVVSTSTGGLAPEANSVIIEGSSNETRVYGFDKYELGSYQTTVKYNGSLSIALTDGWEFFGGGSSQDTVINTSSGSSNYQLYSGHIVQDNSGNQHTFQGFEVFSGFSTVRIGPAPTPTPRSASYSSSSENTSTSEDNASEPIYYEMTNGDDTLLVTEVKNHDIVDTKKGDDAIILTGRASSYSVEHFKDAYITIDGKQYYTGGNYLIITDDDGNQMYIFNATYDDIKSGGIFKNEEDNTSSSNHDSSQDNNSVVNVNNSSQSDDSSNYSDNSNYSDGSNGVRSYSLGLDDNSVQDSQEDSSQGANNLPFELIEDDSLNLSYDDELNVTDDNQVVNVQENSDDDSTNNIDMSDSLDNLMIPVDQQDSNQNQGISENDLKDVLDQTFTNENDDLDNITIDIDSNNNSNDAIDVTSINENLVEETILRESDIDGYKLESERNDDGTLKTINNNSNNGNLGSF